MPHYLNTQAFNTYIDTDFQAVLDLLNMPLKNPNLRQQGAARALGWPNFEKLQVQQQRETNILTGLQVEHCPVQGDRLTIKANNVVVVVDCKKHQLLMSALRPGQEGMALVMDTTSEITRILCDVDETLTVDLDEATLIPVKTGLQWTIPLNYHRRKTGFCGAHALVIERRQEEVFVQVIYDYQGDGGSISQHTLRYNSNDITPNAWQQVKLYRPLDEVTLPDNDGDHFQWLRPIVCDYDGYNETEWRFLHINPNEEICISEMIFSSEAKAQAAIDDEAFGLDREELEELGGVLVRVRKQLVTPSV